MVKNNENQKPVKVLVIGGTRFIGLSLTRRLSRSSRYQVTLLNRAQTPVELPTNVSVIQGDRNHLQKSRDEIHAFRPDVVVNMVAFGTDDTQSLLDTFTGICPYLVMISSCDVYRSYGGLVGTENPPDEKGPIDETSPLRESLFPLRNMTEMPENVRLHYDKILAERLLLAQSALPTTILRLPMVYGPNDPQKRFHEYIVPMLRGDKTIEVEESLGNWVSTYDHVENVTKAMQLAVDQPSPQHRIYNVGMANHFTTQEWITKLKTITNWSGTITTVPTAGDSPLDHFHLRIDARRIRQELGFEDELTVDEALRSIVDPLK